MLKTFSGELNSNLNYDKNSRFVKFQTSNNAQYFSKGLLGSFKFETLFEPLSTYIWDDDSNRIHLKRQKQSEIHIKGFTFWIIFSHISHIKSITSILDIEKLDKQKF